MKFLRLALGALSIALLCACGGGGGAGTSTTGPYNGPGYYTVFGVTLADLATAAAGAPIYVNRQYCSSGCNAVLTTDSVGAASDTLLPQATYCFSLQNPGVGLATAPSIPTFEVGANGKAYLVTDMCSPSANVGTVLFMAE